MELKQIAIKIYKNFDHPKGGSMQALGDMNVSSGEMLQ